MSSGSDVAAGPSVADSGRRRWLFRLSAAGLGLAVFPGIPELCVRWADPPLDGFQAIEFGGDPNTPQLFVNDWDLSWKLRPGARTEFLGESITTDADGFRIGEPVEAGAGRTVLCLGDSTTFGWKMPDGKSYPDVIQAGLAGDRAKGGWRTINAGVPGYSSDQVRRLAEVLIPSRRPDVVVVCVGNNDGWPVERSDREVLNERGGWRRAVVKGVSASRFAIWVKDGLVGGRPSEFVLPDLERAVARVSLDEYRENLRSIAETVRRHGGRLILLSPPVNIDHAPVRIDGTPGFERFQDDARQVARQMSAGRREEGLATVRRLREERPDDYRYFWLEGSVLRRLGRLDEGRERLEEALERDPFPEGCKPSYRRAVSDVGREFESAVIEVNDLFQRQVGAGSPEPLYLDWCHPVALGHRLIAERVLRTIRAEAGGAAGQRSGRRTSFAGAAAEATRIVPTGRLG